MRSLIAVAALALLGCPREPLLDGVPPFAGELVLLKDRPVSGGAMLATVALSPPDVRTDFPGADTPLPGGNENPGRDADLHLELEIRYASEGVQGGNKAGDFVPYLIVEAEVENLDTSQVFQTVLVPHVSLVEGLHYGRNLALIESLGLSEAGYRVRVSIVPPALVTDVDFTEDPRGRSALSPGISIGPDLSPFLAGSVFSLRPLSARALDVIELNGAFTLTDFLSEEDGGGTGGSGGAPGYSY